MNWGLADKGCIQDGVVVLVVWPAVFNPPVGMVNLLVSAPMPKAAAALILGNEMLVDVSVGATDVPNTFGLLMIELGLPRLGDALVAVVPKAPVVPWSVVIVAPWPPPIELMLAEGE